MSFSWKAGFNLFLEIYCLPRVDWSDGVCADWDFSFAGIFTTICSLFSVDAEACTLFLKSLSFIFFLAQTFSIATYCHKLQLISSIQTFSLFRTFLHVYHFSKVLLTSSHRYFSTRCIWTSLSWTYSAGNWFFYTSMKDIMFSLQQTPPSTVTIHLNEDFCIEVSKITVTVM